MDATNPLLAFTVASLVLISALANIGRTHNSPPGKAKIYGWVATGVASVAALIGYILAFRLL